MTGAEGLDPARLRWRWEQPVPLRWLLVDQHTRSGPDSAVAVCADIDGLFVDRPPPPVERYTLLGCAPTGRLKAALDGAQEAWLGNVVLDAAHQAGRPRPSSCDPVPVGCRACMEQLLDVTVVAFRPSAMASRLVDVDLDGRLRPDGRFTKRTTAQSPDAASYRLTGRGEQFGSCRDVAGVFRLRPEPPVRPVTLLGCRPEPSLRAALDALARGEGNPGGAPHRRRVDATIFSLPADGEATQTLDRGLRGSVTGARASALGHGLVDVSFDSGVADPMPSGAREIWERWRLGRPGEPNEWAGHDRELRHQWAGAAMRHYDGGSDRPAGTTYQLDGRHVCDVEGFYCAIGEAVNGPGGYFGWNGNALHDCVRGGWGAEWPFRLVWHDSAVARAHLVPGYDRRAWAPAVTLDDLLRWLADDGIEVELR